MLRNAGNAGLSTQPDALCTGSNGGYQALGLAIAAGARRVALLGYDMRMTAGRANWHTDHKSFTDASWYTTVYPKAFKTLVLPEGVKVLNCTPGSALDCFPRHTLESVLPDP